LFTIVMDADAICGQAALGRPAPGIAACIANTVLSKDLEINVGENDGQQENARPSSRPVCFVIMPISDIHGYDPGHFGRVYEYILKPAIVNAGFTPLRSDDTTKTDYIVVGIVQKVVDSPMVLCDFSARNPNVMYELGIRHAFSGPVTLIRDTQTDKVFDIQGLRYTEYDAGLRIDTVQKDIAKIAAAIKETAESRDSGFNSVVSLAGIKSATIPEKQEISADTQLLLQAIASLESRVDPLGSRSGQRVRFFEIADERVTFGDGSQATLGDRVYDGDQFGVPDLGTLVDIHPGEMRIFIKDKDGKVTPFSASSIKSKGLTIVGF
jgi:hypothetical protein